MVAVGEQPDGRAGVGDLVEIERTLIRPDRLQQAEQPRSDGESDQPRQQPNPVALRQLDAQQQDCCGDRERVQRIEGVVGDDRQRSPRVAVARRGIDRDQQCAPRQRVPNCGRQRQELHQHQHDHRREPRHQSSMCRQADPIERYQRVAANQHRERAQQHQRGDVAPRAAAQQKRRDEETGEAGEPCLLREQTRDHRGRGFAGALRKPSGMAPAARGTTNQHPHPTTQNRRIRVPSRLGSAVIASLTARRACELPTTTTSLANTSGSA